MKSNQNIAGSSTTHSFRVGMREKLLFFLCVLSSFVFAQTPTFVAQVSKNKVVVGEVFQIAFTINGAGGNVSLPNINNDFNVAGGPNQSNSMSMVNGNISQSTTISLFIAAKKEGKFTIGAATCCWGRNHLANQTSCDRSG